MLASRDFTSRDFGEHHKGCPYIRKTSPNKDWELCHNTTIGGFGLNDSDLDSFASVAYVTPDSPSSIIATASATHAQPSLHPEMDAEERFQRLEQELAVNPEANSEFSDTLWAIMQKLNSEPEQRERVFLDPEDDPMPSAHTPNVPNPMFSMTSRVRPASPSDFDGDRDRGRAFLNSCSIYFAICGDQFPNDQARIHWALSFFKSDRAARFANKILRSERAGHPHYSDWKAFETDFVDHFTPKNEQLSALTRLEGAGWYQGKDSVEEYIDRFTELIDLAEYHDNKMIVIKF